MKFLLRFIGSILAIILIVMGIRMFCVGSYYISTNSVAKDLQQGDFVLVNKMSGEANPGFNRIVLYKSSLPKDRENSPLFIGRCVGMPGDTVQITQHGYYINGRLFPHSSSNQENVFRIQKDIKESLLNLLQHLQIPYRDVAEDSLSLIIRLTAQEVMAIRQNLPAIITIEPVTDDNIRFSFVIPYQDFAYRLDSVDFVLYRDIMINESNGSAVFRDGKLEVAGEEQSFWHFRQNYYWIMADHEEAIYSRHLGLIAESSIVGNVWFCWFSKNKERLFKRIN
jgi:signal peptidase I